MNHLLSVVRLLLSAGQLLLRMCCTPMIGSVAKPFPLLFLSSLVTDTPHGENQFLTWQSDEGLTLHPSSQQAVKDWWSVLLLEPGEQRHQLGH